jgi:hypothetical protein
MSVGEGGREMTVIGLAPGAKPQERQSPEE